MTRGGTRDTRQRLLEAAAELISDAPGQDIPLRAICARVGVKLPTLYHFFGNKEGLLDAVIDHGFDEYLSVKTEHESSGDPVQDIRDGWDAHVDFGLAHPGFYALMYGQVTPGRRPEAQERATGMLRELTARADVEGRLAVPPEQAADHVLATNVGLTLHLIANGPDPTLSAAVREATLGAITGVPAGGPNGVPGPDRALSGAAKDLLGLLGTQPGDVDGPELLLLRKWLTDLARGTAGRRVGTARVTRS